MPDTATLDSGRIALAIGRASGRIVSLNDWEVPPPMRAAVVASSG